MQKRMQSLVFVLFMSIILAGTAAGAADVLSTTVPVCFVQNDGQTDEQILFFANSPGYTLFLTRDGQIMATAAAAAAVGITYPGAGSAVVSGEDLLAGKASFFLGNDPDAWVTDVPMYSTVRYDGLYDGITLFYHGGVGILKREFIVGPGADPSLIRMEYAGQESLALDESGAVLIGTAAGLLFETAPICFQVVDGEQVDVACEYVISGDTVSFSLGAYDTSLPLVIDPVLDFSTYFGGNNEDRGAGIALDKNGYIYIVGSTKSTNLPLANFPPLHQPPILYGQLLNGSWDVFVAVVDPNVNPSQLLFSTYIGGKSTDMGTGIAVNNTTGMVTITGYTDSVNYPNTTGSVKQNKTDVFVTRLDPWTSSLIWSTYLGGNQTDRATAIALRSNGAPIIVGTTDSSDFVGLSGALGGQTDGFVARLTNAGAWDSGSWVGGMNNDYIYAVALDPSNNIWVTGSTLSPNFPTTSVIQPSKSGKTDAFITKLNAAGTAVTVSTFIGALGDDVATGIALNATGYPIITGYTDSAVSPLNLFPARPGAFQQTYGGGKSDGFITMMTPILNSIVYSTYLGGNYEDRPYAIAVDSMGNAYVTGYTDSTTFPTEMQLPGYGTLNGLATDIFVTILNETGKGLLFSTYFGGSYYDEGRAIAVTGDGLNIPLTGFTASINFQQENALQPYLAGYQPVLYDDAFIMRIKKVPPVANFTSNRKTGCSPTLICFNDTSLYSPTEWFWDFGDLTNSTEQNPCHEYINPGPLNHMNFTVNLTVWNSDGSDSIEKKNYTTICPNININFIADNQTGCLGQNATIIFNATPPYIGGPMTGGWNWSFGDGKYSNTRNTTHTYTSVGNYTVTLTATNDCCSNSTVMEFIDIREKPVADFYAIPTAGLAPLDVNFFDNSTGRPSSWYWMFGAQQGNSTDQNSSHTYNDKGHYRVRLQVCNFCGDDWENKSAYIKVGDPNLSFMKGITKVTPEGRIVVPTNDTTPLFLFLQVAENGLSGYNLYTRFGDTSAGNITDPVKLPAWANPALSNSTPLPGPDVTINAIDLTGIAVPPGSPNVLLATFNLTGLTPMKIWFNVTPNQLHDQIGNPISTTSIPAELEIVRLLPFPGKSSVPTDPYGDQFYWNVNGIVNGTECIDFNDVITYYQAMNSGWIQANQYIPFFDYNGNGIIDNNDVIRLFQKVGPCF